MKQTFRRKGYLRIPHFTQTQERLYSGGYAECKEHPDKNYIEPVAEMVSVCCGVPVKPDSDICWGCNNHTELKEMDE